jgi:hypothetical protein
LAVAAAVVAVGLVGGRWRLRRISTAAVGQCQLGHGLHIGQAHLVMARQRCLGAGGAQHHQVGTHAFGTGLLAQLRNGIKHRIGPDDMGQLCACGRNLRAQLGLCLRMLGAELGGVPIKGHAGAHDALARVHIGHIGQAHKQAKAVQQLRAQLAFFGVHRANQRNARGMLVRDAIALDAVGAAGADIEQQVHQAIGQQVDLVHIQNALVRLGQQAGAELHGRRLQGGLQIQRALQLFFSGSQRQVHKMAARQQLGQRPGAGGFGSAARAFDQYAAQLRIDRQQQQGLLQRGLALNGAERKMQIGGGAHRISSRCSVSSKWVSSNWG